ncbi:MAG: hypothetical protein E7502_01125 [Ruminococcus sp.]|nr:hypothetical protein [Ruminococcus sp.]
MVKIKIDYNTAYYRAINRNTFIWWVNICVTILLWCFAILQMTGLVADRYFWMVLLFAVLYTISQLIQSAFFTTKIRNRNSPDPQAVWTFDEHGMTVDFSIEGRRCHEEFDFSQVAVMKEYKDYFCMKLKEPQMNIFMKHCIIEGTADELRVLFQKQLGNRFHLK